MRRATDHRWKSSSGARATGNVASTEQLEGHLLIDKPP
jgi:hypothetical protein